MGNSAATLSITLDHERTNSSGVQLASRAGEPVHGKITVQVSKTIKNVGGIHLFFIGKEKARAKFGTHPVSAQRNLVRSQVVAIKFNQRQSRIEPGVHQFGFSFVLPSVLPTTMSWAVGSDSCQIKYKLKAAVVATSGKHLTETERPFLVASKPLSDTLVPCFIDPISRDIKSMGGLLNKGSVALGVSVKDTHIGRGQNVEICFASRNISTVDIKEVEAKLVETVRLAIPNENSKRTKGTLKTMRIPELAMQKRTRKELHSSKKSENRASPLETTYQEIYNDLISEAFKVKFPIPSSTRDTYYAGHIIGVSHHLEITYQTQNLSDNPSVQIPLKIGYPPLPTETTEAAPDVASLQPVPVPIQAEFDESDYDGVPVAHAVAPSDLYDSQEPAWAPVVEIPAENIIVGGTATEMVDDANDDDSGWIGLVPVPPPSLSPPTLDSLLEEMLSSVNDFDIISTKVADPQWSLVFSSLTPNEFGSIIAHVNVDFDQPRIASLLAARINGGRSFTHEYIIAALKSTAKWNRPTMLRELLPLCSDYDNGRQFITDELSTWEQTVSSRDLAAALNRTS